MRGRLFGLAVLAAAAVPAAAQERADRYATAAIAQGDFVTAERTLVAEQRIFPDRAEILLNLAAVYARTGRPAAARALYDHVLAQDNVSLALPRDRTADSHLIARTGLRRLDGADGTLLSSR